MGIKLAGFVCDNCSVFEQHIGVKSGLDLLDDMEKKDVNNIEDLNVTMGFTKIPDWHYYNVIELEGDWISWVKGNSICLCPICDRKYKLNEIISKLKSHD